MKATPTKSPAKPKATPKPETNPPAAPEIETSAHERKLETPTPKNLNIPARKNSLELLIAFAKLAACDQVTNSDLEDFMLSPDPLVSINARQTAEQYYAIHRAAAVAVTLAERLVPDSPTTPRAASQAVLQRAATRKLDDPVDVHADGMDITNAANDIGMRNLLQATFGRFVEEADRDEVHLLIGILQQREGNGTLKDAVAAKGLECASDKNERDFVEQCRAIYRTRGNTTPAEKLIVSLIHRHSVNPLTPEIVHLEIGEYEEDFKDAIGIAKRFRREYAELLEEPPAADKSAAAS